MENSEILETYPRAQKKGPPATNSAAEALEKVGSGGWIGTSGLWVMSPLMFSSYLDISHIYLLKICPTV
jgi:hypothetical protein